MIQVKIPSICQNEQKYVIGIMLGEFLGLEYKVETYSGDVMELSLAGDRNRLTIDTSFFHIAEKSWLQSDSLPTFPLKQWDPKVDGLSPNLLENTIPILYGQGGFLKYDKNFHLKVDILSLIHI